ncbi:MAG: MFS transporter [Cyanobacteria bacterium PR.3.49]|nr:MFS transporter [Cyanobacteria bacterium PR.3.49]
MSDQKKTSAAAASSTFAPGAKSALWLLLAINLFNWIDRQVLAAVVPNIREEFFAPGAEPGPFVQGLLNFFGSFLGGHPENAMIGLLAMAFMVTYMISAPIFGALNMKRWWIIAFGVILWSLASGASGLAMGFGVLLLTRCFVGIGEAAYGPIAPAMLSDIFPVNVRGKIMAFFYLAIPIGAALGFVLGGLVAAKLGWQWAFYLVVPPGIILGIWCLFMKEPTRGGADNLVQQSKQKMKLKDYMAILKIPSFRFDTFGMAAMTFAMGGISFWIPSYIHEYRGVPDLAQVNLIFGGILVVAGIGGTIFGGWIADRMRERFSGSYFIVSAAAMLVGFPLWIAALYVPFPYAWGLIFGACFCLFVSTGPSNTILANVTHPMVRASAFALNILIIHALGDVISPMIIGAVADATGGNMNTAFLVVSAFILLAGVLWLWGARYLGADTAKVAAASGSPEDR